MDVLKLKLFMAAAGGLTVAWFGYVWEAIALVMAAIVLDYVTGLLAGRATEGLNSRKASKGLYKKMGFLSLLVLGFFMDVAFNYFIASGFNFEMPFNLPIGLIVSAWIVVTEAISICENIQRLGVDIPSWLLKLLKKSNENIDRKDD